MNVPLIQLIVGGDEELKFHLISPGKRRSRYGTSPEALQPATQDNSSGLSQNVMLKWHRGLISWLMLDAVRISGDSFFHF